MSKYFNLIINMTEKMQNKIKDININLINNYNSDITKNKIPVSNISTNIDHNSFSQENIFNEIMNSANLRDFSEIRNINKQNQNIIMNKDQLYHTFILFNKFINLNQYKKNNTINAINMKNKEFNDNIDDIRQIQNQNNNKNNRQNINENKIKNIIINEDNNNLKELKKNKSDTNIINNKEHKKEIDYRNNIILNIKKNQNNTIENKEMKNPYDDIPIKLNKINFIDLVEKKLADEKENNIKDEKKNINYSRKIIKRLNNKINKNKDDNQIIKEDKINAYRESVNEKNKVLKRNKNELINYSYDKEETRLLLQENKNTIENSLSLINNINNMNIIKNKKIEYKIEKFEIIIKKEIEDKLDKKEKYDEKEKILNKKIKEMNKEIIKLKEEQNKINKVKLEYDKLMIKLNNDLYQFNQKKEEFEKYKKNETNKLKNNKKNLIIEYKYMKEIKNKNLELINKSKKDREIIDSLKNKINNLQLILKQKENNFYYNKYKSPNTKYKNNIHNTFNNISEIRLNQSHNKGLYHSIDDKMKNIENINNIIMKRNKNNNELNSKDQIIEKEYENRYNSTSHSIYNKTNQNESSGYLSISQKILNNSLNKNKNERLLFSPKPCKTSVGYGFKKLSLKLNNQTENKKAYENKQYENQVSNTNEIINNNDNNDNNENNEKNYKNKNKVEIKIKNKNNKKFIRKSITNMIFSPDNKNKLNIKIKKNRMDNLNNSATNKKTNNLFNDKKNIKVNKIKEKEREKKEYDFVIPIKYKNKKYKLIKTLKEDDKIINIYDNDKTEIKFKSGIKKEIYKNEHQIIYFPNGDIKQIFSDGKISYYYKDKNAVQTILNNGMEIFKLENGQIEKHFPDGTKLIIFNDDTEKYIYNDGSEETYFSDGNVEKNKNIIMEKALEEDN